MTTVQRFDLGRLDRAKRTGAGGARVPASISRTGVQTYTDQHGRVVREYRPPEAVFAQESLDTLGSIPVTEGHPPMGVNPMNHRELSVGHVSDAPPARRKDVSGPLEWLETAVVLSDGDTLRKVETGELVEVSMGYLAEVIDQPGVTPDGQHYDAMQTNIRFNHLALLPDGHARAGSGARLRLDGNQETTPMFVRNDDNTTPTKARVKVDGIECDFGSDTHVQMLERSVAAQTKRADEATAALATATNKIGELKAIVDAHKPVDVNALVQDELAFRSQMLPALTKGYDFASKSRDTVRADAVGPTVMAEVAKLPEGERPGYITAHLRMKLDAAGRQSPTLHVPSPIPDGANPTKPRFRDKRLDAYNAAHGIVTGAGK